jgi:phenylpyruvate tautomerase PptA (4-oxalocrotonate tautomerase family)
MPIYQVGSRHGMLTPEMKQLVATAITDAHVDATGAPPVFVHVFVNEIPPGIAYSAGELDNNITGITGAIRAGALWSRSRRSSSESTPIGVLSPDSHRSRSSLASMRSTRISPWNTGSSCRIPVTSPSGSSTTPKH